MSVNGYLMRVVQFEQFLHHTLLKIESGGGACPLRLVYNP